MECVGEYQHQPQDLPYLCETLILPKPTPPKRRSEPGSRLYFANSFIGNICGCSERYRMLHFPMS